MSIQYIIDNAGKILINKHAVVSQTISRSMRIKTAERGYRVWRFTVSPSIGRWADLRGIIEAIDTKDKITETQITLANNAGMSWTTAYQGDLTQQQYNALTISAVSGNTITISTLPTISSSAYLFKAGDYIQPNGSRYPYTITADIQRGSGNTVNAILNRGMIQDVNMTNRALLVGNQVTWRVIPVVLPAYSLVPGRLVEWDGDFELMEVIL